MLTPIAAFVGIAVGLLRGGRFKNLANLSVRWLPVIVVGLVAHVLADQFVGFGGVPLLFAGSVVLIAGLLRNLHLRGTTIVSLGLLLNLVVLAFNGHVPTRFESLDAVDQIQEGWLPADITGIGPVGQLETDETTLAVLGDVIPVPGINEVISFGDLIVVAGLFVLCMNLMLSRRPSGVSIDELLGLEAMSEDSDQLGWGNEDIGSFDTFEPSEGVINVAPLSRDIDLRDEPELAPSNSEDELLAPFPYPDSSTR